MNGGAAGQRGVGGGRRRDARVRAQDYFLAHFDLKTMEMGFASQRLAVMKSDQEQRHTTALYVVS